MVLWSVLSAALSNLIMLLGALFYMHVKYNFKFDFRDLELFL